MRVRETSARVVVGPGRLRFRYVLMLALALEVMVLGVRCAESYSPTGVVVEQTIVTGHVIT